MKDSDLLNALFCTSIRVVYLAHHGSSSHVCESTICPIAFILSLSQSEKHSSNYETSDTTSSKHHKSFRRHLASHLPVSRAQSNLGMTGEELPALKRYLRTQVLYIIPPQTHFQWTRRRTSYQQAPVPFQSSTPLLAFKRYSCDDISFPQGQPATVQCCSPGLCTLVSLESIEQSCH